VSLIRVTARPTFSVVGAIFLSLLPMLLIGCFFSHARR